MVPKLMSQDVPRTSGTWKRVIVFSAGMVFGFLGAAILLVEEISPTLTICTYLLSGLFLVGALLFLLSAVFGCIEWVDVVLREVAASFCPWNGKAGPRKGDQGPSQNSDEAPPQPE